MPDRCLFNKQTVSHQRWLQQTPSMTSSLDPHYFAIIFSFGTWKKLKIPWSNNRWTVGLFGNEAAPLPLTVKVMEAFGYGTSVRKWADNENDQDVFSASSFWRRKKMLINTTEVGRQQVELKDASFNEPLSVFFFGTFSRNARAAKHLIFIADVIVFLPPPYFLKG